MLIKFLAVQEEFRRSVIAIIAAASYGQHFTSPKLGLFINNTKTSPATNEALVSSNLLRSNYRVN